MVSHHEDDEQAALFKWAAYFPELRWLHAIPNGGNRNAREAARLKAQGVKPGVYDVFLPLPAGDWHGLYIEIKRTKRQGRSNISDSQKCFGNAMQERGYKAIVCYGAAEAITAIRNYKSLIE